MATLNEPLSIDTTARTSTLATTPTISSPPSDSAAAMDVLEVRPPARTRPDLPTPLNLVIGFEDRTVKLNVFQLHEALKRFKPVDIYRPPKGNGKVEVEMASESDAKKLLSTTSLEVRSDNRFLSVPIKVSPHTTKNSCRGVVSCRDLRDVPEDEILAGLTDQGVTEVKKMFRRGNNESTDSGTFLLVFAGTTLPEKVHVGWMAIRVRPFVPNPTRCFRCQAFGHIAGSCRGTERCGRCSEEGHSSAACEAAKPKCAGCGNEHEAWSRSCPKLTEAKQAQKKKTPAPPKSAPAPTPTPSGPKPPPNRSPYRDALMGAQQNVPLTENANRSPTPESNPNLNVSIGALMHLSLRELLSLITSTLPFIPNQTTAYATTEMTAEKSTQTEVTYTDITINEPIDNHELQTTNETRRTEQSTQTETNSKDTEFPLSDVENLDQAHPAEHVSASEAEASQQTSQQTKQTTNTTETTNNEPSGKRAREDSPTSPPPTAVDDSSPPSPSRSDSAPKLTTKKARVVLSRMDKCTTALPESLAAPLSPEKGSPPTSPNLETTQSPTPLGPQEAPMPPPPPPPLPPTRMPPPPLPLPLPPPKLTQGRDRGRAHSTSHDWAGGPRSQSREPVSTRRPLSRDRYLPVWERETTFNYRTTLTGGVPFQGRRQPR